MKKIILCVLLLGLAATGRAQQTALYSQYMTNYYLLNPAAIGTEADINLKAGYRNQWVGFEGAPKTYYLSGHASLSQKGRSFKRMKAKPSHAVGGYVYSDQAGPVSRTGLNASYAYHIPLSRHIYNSVGITAGIQQYAFNVHKVRLAENSNGEDPVTMGGSRSAYLPDLSLGYYIYSKDFYAGLSLAQAIGFKIFDYELDDALKGNKLYRHLFFSAGYSYALNRQLSLQPSTLLKYVNAAPLQADLNLRAIYNFNNRLRSDFDDEIWMGLSYRSGDALVGLFGLQFMEQYQLSYAYDFTLSALRTYSAGSHEIVVGYRISR